ncbi:MAG: pyridoxal phosphate-dependent aminotransferase [Elusimicrobiota bacterium]
MTRRIPPAGINLFQLIYLLQKEYTEKTGLPVLNLSLGNPDTVPDDAILELQSRFARDREYAFHTYAEDKNLRRFAEGMIELHGRIRIEEYTHLRGLPIPGIKTAGGLLPLACGLHLPDRKRRGGFTVVSNLPAYDVIGTWADGYLGAERVVWPLASQDNMRLNINRLQEALKARSMERADLIYVIRPGNPAAVGATAEEWKALIEHCIERGTRLVNDAAYAGLAGDSHMPLAAAAKDYPELEWIEMYSVSKSFSDPGGRLGALVGSRDFVEDFNMVKGNTESGPVPYVMAAYGEFFKDMDKARAAMSRLAAMYWERVDYLFPRLEDAGFRPACRTEAGFFTLWKVPRKVLGTVLAEDPETKDLPAQEAFNRKVISETGIVGVHFAGSEPLIRYAVCTDVLAPEFRRRFEEQLGRLELEY